MAGIEIGGGSTTERLFKSSSVSRNSEFADRAGPVERGADIGRSAAILTEEPRGVLKKTNVGDINSTVDQVSGETQKSAARVKAKVNISFDKGSKLNTTG